VSSARHTLAQVLIPNTATKLNTRNNTKLLLTILLPPSRVAIALAPLHKGNFHSGMGAFVGFSASLTHCQINT
jgi:hypothetical protein